MIDDRERFERASLRFDPSQGGLERLLRRRDRRRRNRRIGSAVMALIIAVAATGTLIATFKSGRTVPATPTLTPTTVSDLKPVWTARLDGQAPGQFLSYGGGVDWRRPLPPVVVGGVVYVGTRAGTVYAFLERCASDCGPLWTGAVGSPITFDPTVADGMVFAGTDDGGLFAFRTDCGSDGETCKPEWSAHLGGSLMSSPVLANGVVYGVDVDGQVVAFRVDCGTGGATCDPLWTTPLTSNPLGSASLADTEDRPTVVGGAVYVVDPSTTRLTALDAGTGNRLWYGRVRGTEGAVHALAPTVDGGMVFESFDSGLYAFSVHCRTDGRSCPPEWIGAELPVGLVGLGTGHQVVAGGRVFVVRQGGLTRCCHTGVLLAWDERCGSGGATCRPVWVSANDHASGMPLVVADGAVYSAATRGGQIRAYPTSCEGIGTSCGPIWRALLGGMDLYAPTVEGDVIFAGSKQGTVYAFSAGCKATCQPVWTSGPLGAQVSSPAVDESTIFVIANDGTLRAFGAHPISASERQGVAWPVGPAALGGLLLVGWIVFRRRRRGQLL
jgi:outer membrane protein assembly factor BamB